MTGPAFGAEFDAECRSSHPDVVVCSTPLAIADVRIDGRRPGHSNALICAHLSLSMHSTTSGNVLDDEADDDAMCEMPRSPWHEGCEVVADSPQGSPSAHVQVVPVIAFTG